MIAELVWEAEQGNQNKVFCNLDLIQTQALLRKRQTQPVTKIRSDSLELVVRLTAAGHGFGILPEQVIRLLGADLRREESSLLLQDNICVLYRPEFGKSQIEIEVAQALLGRSPL